MACALFLTIIMCMEFSPLVVAFSLGAAVLVFVGLVDDKYSISPKMKFMGEIIASLIFISLSQQTLTDFGNIFGFGDLPLYSFSTAVTVFAMVGFINALNLSDGLDGLTAGITVVASIFLLFFAYISNQSELLGIIAVTLGISIGFLRHNTYPAKLFMGDTGSLLLGYSVGCITLSLIQKAPAQLLTINPITVFIVVSLPVLDTLHVIVARVKKRGRVFAPDKTHLHHRLLALGLPHPFVVTIIYLLSFLLGLLAWNVKHLTESYQFYLIITLFILFYTSLWLLEKNDVHLRSQYPLKRTRYRIIALLGQSNRYFPRIFTLGLLFPLPFLPKATEPFGLWALLTSGFVLFIYPWKGGKNDMGIAQAIIFLLIFSLVSQYLFIPLPPSWLMTYMTFFSVSLTFWVAVRITFRRRYQIIMPTSFEMLLILFSWFIPLVIGPALHLNDATQYQLLLACAFSIPILAGAKTMMRRYARRNTKFVIFMEVALFIIGIKTFL